MLTNLITTKKDQITLVDFEIKKNKFQKFNNIIEEIWKCELLVIISIQSFLEI